jgi:FAD/FMN-containing dehydrogenase
MTNNADSIVYRTLDGSEAQLPRGVLSRFVGALGGHVTTGGEAYERARTTWNAMVEHRPAVIAHCSSTEDVTEAIAFARAHTMLLSVRGGGHHVAGNAVADGGLEIDLSPMRGVRVDAAKRRAFVGGGALLGDVDAATQAHGLGVPLGINSTTGFGGLCLGGGFGWLTRKLGLTIDNLVSASLVTAEGDALTVSAANEPDLFWAIRGGGGNFGVVTSFELALHPVGPLVHSAIVAYPASDARDILMKWRELTANAPEELTVWALLRKAPPLPFLPAEVHGTDVVVLVALYVGDPAEGARATAPLLRFGKPHGHVAGPQPYVAFQQMFDPLLAAGARNYWKTNEFVDLADGAIDAVIEGSRALPGPECEIFIASLGGAMGRVSSNATAYAGRSTRYVMNAHGRWRSPAEDATVRTWARALFDATAPFATGGGYVNFLTADEQARVESAYGSNYARLRDVKERFDPDNVFRMNHNIPPREIPRRVKSRSTRITRRE